jgi:Leucine-rich repeat (LRR) protein
VRGNDYAEGDVVACFRYDWGNRTLITNEMLAEMVKDGIIPKNITHLKISEHGWTRNDGLSDISPLAELTELVWLDLEGNVIEDLTPLAGLTKLRRLDLDHNPPINDITPLAGLVNMVELDMRNTRISDITPLANMTKLEELDIRATDVRDYTPILGHKKLWNLELGGLSLNHSFPLPNRLPRIDLSPLAELESLTHLNLRRGAGVVDLATISGLTNLTHLNMHRSGLTNISPLATLTNLEYLDLSRNGITDVSALAGMTKLTELRIGGNWLNDPTPLINLKGVTSLTINSSNSSVANVAKLRETIAAMTWCTIHHNVQLVNFCEGCHVHWTRCECDHLMGAICEDCGVLDGYIVLNRRKICTKTTTRFDFTTLGVSNSVHTSLTDVSFAKLSRLENLTHLNLFITNVNDLTPLAGLTKLEDVTMRNLSETAVQNLDVLEGLTNIKHFRIGLSSRTRGNGKAFETIGKFENLETLWLESFGIHEFDDLTPLQNLTKLQRVTLAHSERTAEAKLRDALPGVTIATGFRA